MMTVGTVFLTINSRIDSSALITQLFLFDRNTRFLGKQLARHVLSKKLSHNVLKRFTVPTERGLETSD